MCPLAAVCSGASALPFPAVCVASPALRLGAGRLVGVLRAVPVPDFPLPRGSFGM